MWVGVVDGPGQGPGVFVLFYILFPDADHVLPQDLKPHHGRRVAFVLHQQVNKAFTALPRHPVQQVRKGLVEFLVHESLFFHPQFGQVQVLQHLGG